MSEDWRREANCAGLTDAELNMAFGSPAEQDRFVRKFCRRCPVGGSCLEWALLMEADLPLSHRNGVFGGWTSTERAALTAGRVWPCRSCGQLVAAKSRQQVRCGRCGRAWKKAAEVARNRERVAEAAAAAAAGVRVAA